MPKTKSGKKRTQIPVGFAPAQIVMLERLVRLGIYGTSEPDVIRFFVTKELEHLVETKVLDLTNLDGAG